MDSNMFFNKLECIVVVILTFFSGFSCIYNQFCGDKIMSSLYLIITLVFFVLLRINILEQMINDNDENND